ncbi:MAG: hypothetical protein E6929_03595 [Clostridium sp.]|nr:hypothetical protein [Clostridium sp.]
MKKLISSVLSIMLACTLFTGCKSAETKEETRLASKYTDIIESKKFYMDYDIKMDMPGIAMNANAKMSVDGENIAVSTKLGEDNSNIQMRIVIKDTMAYMINDVTKMMITMENDSNLQGIDKEQYQAFQQGTSDLTFVGKGEEEKFGEKLVYEEYKGKNEENLKYYFKDKEIKGITISGGDIVDSIDVKINEIKKEYPKDAFNIPEDYTKMTMEDFMKEIQNPQP